MATVSKPLTKEEFRSLYAGKKPYFEYWFGEAIQKSMPTWLHGVLQGILRDLLRNAGYKSGSELFGGIAQRIVAFSNWRDRFCGARHRDGGYHPAAEANDG